MLSEWDRDILSQIKSKAEGIAEGKVFKVIVFFKIETPNGVHHMLSFAYCPRATDIDKAFEKLIEPFRGSNIVNFDVQGVDEIPSAPSPLVKSAADIENRVIELTDEALNEVSRGLPPSVRGRKAQIALEGGFIFVDVRVIDNSIVYDFSSTGSPSTATSLALFLRQRASKINKSSISTSITRARDLEILDIVKEKDLTTIYV